jgi:hypothetical protein
VSISFTTILAVGSFLLTIYTLWPIEGDAAGVDLTRPDLNLAAKTRRNVFHERLLRGLLIEG